MDKKALFENMFREGNEKGLFNGTWLYAENGEIVAKGAVGWSDPEDSIPLKEDMLFDLGSVSKNFTATAVMLARRKGLLSLDDEITNFFPEIPYKGVTVRNLLNHTGGLPDYMAWIAETAIKENTIPRNEIIVRFLCECGKEPLFAPGEKWEYSNTGYCLLAQIVEEVTGVPFEEFLKKNIFEPAGMTSTSVIHRRKDGLKVDNLAYGLVTDFDPDKYVLPDISMTSNFVVPLDGMFGDGCVHSNIFDLLKWDRALREGTVLTKEEQDMMYTPGKLNNGEPAVAGIEPDAPNYGFGWEVGNEPDLGLVVCHSGSWPGYWSWFERFLDADRTLILLRCRDASDGRGHRSFLQSLRAIAKGKEPGSVIFIEDLEIKNPDRSGWDAWCGEYEAPADADIYLKKVYMDGDDLYGSFVIETGTADQKLYQLGEKEFGLKKYPYPIIFDENCVQFMGETCKKL